MYVSTQKTTENSHYKEKYFTVFTRILVKHWKFIAFRILKIYNKLQSGESIRNDFVQSCKNFHALISIEVYESELNSLFKK